MNGWYDWLASDYFRIVVVFSSAALGVWMKSEARHHEKQDITMEDLAVGVPLIQTAAISFLLLATRRAIQLHNALIVTNTNSLNANSASLEQLSSFMMSSGLELVSLMLLLFGTASLMRRYGWADKDNIKIPFGLAVPIAVGIVCLYAVMRSGQ
jgi:hypothetical protein